MCGLRSGIIRVSCRVLARVVNGNFGIVITDVKYIKYTQQNRSRTVRNFNRKCHHISSPQSRSLKLKLIFGEKKEARTALFIIHENSKNENQRKMDVN